MLQGVTFVYKGITQFGIICDFDHGTRVGHPMTDPVRGSRGGPTGDPKEAGPVDSGPHLGHHLVA